MNREQRRSLGKKGAESSDLSYLNNPCTIGEAAQIARGAALDVLQGYASNENHLKVAMSLQIEVLKEVIISAGLITEEQFREKYMQRAEEFNRMQQEMMNLASDAEDDSEDTEAPVSDVSMGMQDTDIEVVNT